jgi:hypothetical protein
LKDIDFFFSFLSFLPDFDKHCGFSHTLSVTKHLFIVCLVRWRGMVAPVFTARAMCAGMYGQLLLCDRIGLGLQSL